jgi:hypothetical protein
MFETMEEKILRAVGDLVVAGVNGVLEGLDVAVPLVEGVAGDGFGGYGVRPAVSVAAVERSGKERIVRLDAYAVPVVFSAPLADCYRYAYALERALAADCSLGGVADWAELVSKRYAPGKAAARGDTEAVFTLRVTVEK